VTTTDLPSPGELPEVTVDPAAMRHLADAQVNVELDTGDMVLNIGPQHPATHGTLRLVVRLDGERVVSADPIIGYMHRGYEKLTEFRTYPQITTLINRIDWLSSFANEVPFIAAAEQLMSIEAPPRAQYQRTILTELSRIATFLLFLGEMGLQVGAITPAFYGFRDREYVLNLIEAVTGGRFHPNFNRIGGIKDDLPWGWISECRTTMNKVLASCDEFDDLVVGNPIFQKRTRSIGIIPQQLGAAYGVSGSNLRASGVDWDLRRAEPYLAYAECDFRVPVYPEGDVYARYRVHIEEMRESTRIVAQCLDRLEGMEGEPWIADDRKVVLPPREELHTSMESLIHHFKIVTEGYRVPEGEVYVPVESPRGEFGCYVVSDGGPKPWRVKFRAPSFVALQATATCMSSAYVADMIAIVGSLDTVMGEVDR